MAIFTLPSRYPKLVIPCSLLLLASLFITLCLADDDDATATGFNHSGNILIADQFNNRVIEVDRATHAIIWQFGSGSSTPGPSSIVGTNDAERVGELTLISGTGIPATTPPTPPLPGCPTPATGCPDNRVILVDQNGVIVWQYGPDQLNTPVNARIMPNSHVLITDQGNQRIIEVNFAKQIVWQYGTTGVVGNAANQLNNPNSAELLDNNRVLIADENNNRVIEVTRDHKVVATFTAGGTLNGAAYASRLPDGHTLITDSNNNRIVEVDRDDNIMWQYSTKSRPGSVANPLPTRAVRLANGDTLISDQFNDQVIEVTPAKQIMFSQGSIGVAGAGPDLLNGPYDAKSIGDFTGLTRPPSSDSEGDQGNGNEGDQGNGNGNGKGNGDGNGDDGNNGNGHGKGNH